MEKLQVINLGDVAIEKTIDQLDNKFKPGLYRQTEAFVENNINRFSTLSDQIKNAGYIAKLRVIYKNYFKI